MAPRILILLVLLLAPFAALAAGVFQPGFRTLGTWEDDPPARLDISIWYPALREPKDLTYPPWVISGALNAKPAEGRFPLILISHASPVDRFAYHALATALAREGFIVVAPTHRHDCMDNMDDLFTWEQLDKRIREMNLALNLALGEKELAASVDSKRIGLIGFGSGATAALLMGGAMPACVSWPGYCRKAGKNDPYCSPWAKDRLDTLCSNFPLRKSLANPAIKAIAAVAPGFGMIFDADSFRYFYPPLLLIAAGRDSFNRAYLHCQPIAEILGAKARFLDLPEADAGALISPCSPALAEELPELCLSMDGAKKAAIQTRLTETLLAFFSHYLLITGNLPVIKAPPEPEPAPVEAKDQKKKK